MLAWMFTRPKVTKPETETLYLQDRDETETLNPQDRDETETFDFSKLSRPRRDRDVPKNVAGDRDVQDRDYTALPLAGEKTHFFSVEGLNPLSRLHSL